MHLCIFSRDNMKLLLQQAVAKGTLDEVRELIEKNGLPADSQWSDYNLLCAALEQGKVDVAKLLIEKDCRINAGPNSFLPNDTPLHWAIKCDDVELVEILLHKGAWIDIENDKNMTPLHTAVNEENDNSGKIMKMVFLFVRKNCRDNVNPANDENFSFLHVACLQGCRDTAQFLLENGANVNSGFGEDGMTPFYLATCDRNLPLMETLLQYGADPNVKEWCREWTPLHIACELTCFKKKWNQLDFLRDPVGSIKQLSEENQDIKVIKLLLDKQSNPNATDWENKTPFYYVCENLYSIKMGKKVEELTNDTHSKVVVEFSKKLKEILDIFIKHNVDLNIPTKAKSTILHVLMTNRSNICDIPCTRNHEIVLPFGMNDIEKDIYTTIIENGANINAVTFSGLSPLHDSIGYAHPDFTEFLLSHGADPKCVTSMHSKTTLHYAIRNAVMNEKLLNVLLERGVDVDAKDHHGRTALHMLSDVRPRGLWEYWTPKRPYNKVIRILLKHDCDMDAQDEKGRTPLHAACLDTYPLAIRHLLHYGADVNVTDNKGETALSYCIRRKYKVGSTMLIRHVRKLQIIGLHVNQENSRCLSTIKHSCYYNKEFEMSCRREVHRMKSIKLDSLYSLYDIVHKGSNEMVLHVKQKIMKIMIDSNGFNTQFPLYGFLLNLQYRKGLTRSYLLGPAKKSFSHLTNVGFPDSCSERIFRYLKDRSLRNIIYADKLVT